MNVRIQSFVIALILGMATIVISTNASDRVNLVKNGTVSLGFVPSKGIYVSEAYAYQDGDELVISGKVKRRYGTSYAGAGHVDVAVLSPDETVIKQVSTMYVPRIVRRKGARDASFTVRLPIIPPQGTTIYVGYHSSVDKTLSCK